MACTIYVVEDDQNIRELLLYALKSSDFEAHGFERGDELFDAIKGAVPDLLLLDIMLPDESGLSILGVLRNRYKSLPVIMLTAKSSEFDKIVALDAGADDYITKPFSVLELISRIKAVLRRVNNEDTSASLSLSGIVVNQKSHIVTVHGSPVSLTFKEFELLTYLIINKEIVLSRDKLMEQVWGFDFEGESRTVDMHIKTLRQKLGDSGNLIKTVRSVGYKIVGGDTIA